MKNIQVRLAILCGVLAAGLLPAGTLSELDTLKTGYAAEKTRINNAYEQQKTNAFTVYRQSLDAQMLALKKQGDLDTYIVLENEKKRLAAEGSMNTNDAPAALNGLVTQYQKNMAETMRAREKAKLTALRLYVGKLTTLMQNYTKSDRLDDAKIVRNEQQEVKTELTFLEADTPSAEPPKPPAPPPPAAPPVEDLTATIAGTWIFSARVNNSLTTRSETITINADGTVTSIKTKQTGTWELLKERQFIIHWPETDNTMTVSTDGKRLMGHNRQGMMLSAVKSGS